MKSAANCLEKRRFGATTVHEKMMLWGICYEWLILGCLEVHLRRFWSLCGLPLGGISEKKVMFLAFWLHIQCDLAIWWCMETLGLVFYATLDTFSRLIDVFGTCVCITFRRVSFVCVARAYRLCKSDKHVLRAHRTCEYVERQVFSGMQGQVMFSC